MFNNNTSAQAYAREDDGLGDLGARWQATHQAGRHAEFVAAKEDIQRRWKQALLAGDEATAEAVRIEGVKLCNEYYGVEG